MSKKKPRNNKLVDPITIWWKIRSEMTEWRKIMFYTQDSVQNWLDYVVYKDDMKRVAIIWHDPEQKHGKEPDLKTV